MGDEDRNDVSRFKFQKFDLLDHTPRAVDQNQIFFMLDQQGSIVSLFCRNPPPGPKKSDLSHFSIKNHL